MRSSELTNAGSLRYCILTGTGLSLRGLRGYFCLFQSVQHSGAEGFES
jgi:hypothetical protein